MDSAIARITSRCQTTVPEAVREFLDVGPGDDVVLETSEGEVRVRKLPAADREWLKGGAGGLSEWADDLDDEL